MKENYTNNNIDKLTIARIEQMHPQIKKRLNELYLEISAMLPKNITLRFSSTYRCKEIQNQLYSKGRTTEGKIITNAKGGDSYHNYGLAFDVCFLIDTDFNGSYETLKFDYLKECEIVITYFKSNGYKWGGDFKNFKDKPHFERSIKESIKELKESNQIFPNVTLIG